MREQPLRAAQMVVGHRDAEHEVEWWQLFYLAAYRLFRDNAVPLVGNSAMLGVSPRHVEPVRVVADDRRVVERLSVARIGAALEQEFSELVGALVGRLTPSPSPMTPQSAVNGFAPTHWSSARSGQRRGRAGRVRCQSDCGALPGRRM